MPIVPCEEEPCPPTCTDNGGDCNYYNYGSDCCSNKCLPQPKYGRAGVKYCSSWWPSYKCGDSSMCSDAVVSIPKTEFISGALVLIALVIMMLFGAYKIGRKRANKNEYKLDENVQTNNDSQTDLDEEEQFLE
eukprot:476271_1